MTKNKNEIDIPWEHLDDIRAKHGTRSSEFEEALKAVEENIRKEEIKQEKGKKMFKAIKIVAVAVAVGFAAGFVSKMIEQPDEE